MTNGVVQNARGEPWRPRLRERERSGQAQAVGLITLGVDRVVAHEALTYWPRLEGLAPWLGNVY